MTGTLLDADTMRRLEHLALVSRRVAAGRRRGERRSRRRGASTDFADYRNYAPGDDLRFLDWRIYGRLERLFLKLFLEEEDLRVHVLLDVSPSMRHGEPDKDLYARRVAAALGYLALARTDSLTVKTFGDGLARSFGPRRGKAAAAALFRFLGAGGPEQGGTSLLRAFRAFAQGTRVKGLAVVISDFYDFAGYEEALRQLFAGNFEVLAVHVLSPQELAPDLAGDLRLVDCEEGLTTDLSMGPSVLELYGRTVSAFCHGLRSYLVGRGGHYVLTSTATPFERLVFDVLRRRGLVR